MTTAATPDSTDSLKSKLNELIRFVNDIDKRLEKIEGTTLSPRMYVIREIAKVDDRLDELDGSILQLQSKRAVQERDRVDPAMTTIFENGFSILTDSKARLITQKERLVAELEAISR